MLITVKRWTASADSFTILCMSSLSTVCIFVYRLGLVSPFISVYVGDFYNQFLIILESFDSLLGSVEIHCSSCFFSWRGLDAASIKEQC